jgi:hypothetical protein
MMYAHHIEKAANYLLTLLTLVGRVPFACFYDGTESTRRRLAEYLGMSLEDAEWYGAEAILHEAAAALEAQGYVRITRPDEKLADEERAYEIELLPVVRAALAAGFRPRFRDLDL